MVMKKRLKYGSNGYRFPVVPGAPRSCRRRYTPSEEDNQICAFELLAAVAGKLLLESESSASSNATEGKDGPAMQTTLENYKDHMVFSGLQPDHKALESEYLDQGICVESAISPPKAEFQEQKIKNVPMESVRSSHSEKIPMSEKVSCIKLESLKPFNADGIVKCEVEGVNIDNTTVLLHGITPTDSGGTGSDFVNEPKE
ncbi:unnamed protein product [Cuscuta epithymum]|uniref:Uncharacterized protein n=1 Tax=Cuscuta epithymum TaxID=186058 RepID=A0AAV0FNS6_9ASTE|nr:unnamed protein product [Cuscuta epithymum]